MTLRSTRLSIAVFSLSVAASGCGGSPGSAAAASNAPIEVDASGALTFAPAHLTVAAGTTVRWRNSGAVLHTVTSGASADAADSPGTLFDSPLAPGATFDFIFTKVGDQPYFCRHHGSMGMTGVVTVTAPPPTPTGGGTGYGAY